MANLPPKDGLHEDYNGDQYWYKNGQLHREDGPAVEYVTGNKFWYLDDKLHREDGPAIEYADGTTIWCLNDKRYKNGSKPDNWEELVKLIPVEIIMDC